MGLWAPQNSLKSEPYRVLLKRGEWVDHARDSRVIPYKIYHAAGDNLQKNPIIFWSHGFGGNRDGASFISRYLAGQGYTIVHLTHFGTDSSLWEGQAGHPWDILRKAKISRETTVNRMLDVPFALDQLEIWAADNSDIGQYMDFSIIGMSGHSFGAMTTQVIAGMVFPKTEGDLHDMSDDRFKAGILYSPVPIAHLTDATPHEIYGSINIPLLHMTGTDDSSPLEGYDYDYRLIVKDHAQNPDQYLQVLEGGDHMVYNGTRGKLAENPLRDQHEKEILDASYAFWQAHLKGDEGAKAWLQSRYQ